MEKQTELLLPLTFTDQNSLREKDPGKRENAWQLSVTYFCHIHRRVRSPHTCTHLQLHNNTFSSVQLLSRFWLFATPWTAARQASLSTTLSTTNSRSSCKLMSIESVMPSNPLILCRPLSSCLQSFPASGSFQMSQLFAPGGQSIGVSASTSVLPMNTQDWSPLGRTDWISLQSKGLARVFSNTTLQKHQFFSTQLSL